MRKTVLLGTTVLWVIGVVCTGMVWAEMVVHLHNGQEIRLPVAKGDVARIEYTDNKSAATGTGVPWTVDSEGGIYRRTRNSWQRMPGLAKDIGVGANGSVWITGTDATGGGYGIYSWNGSDWTRIDGGAVRIAVAPDGAPWIVNSEGGIYRRTRNSWQRMPGLANDIGVGANGSVWIIGTDATGGGYGIYHWNGSNWTRIDGGAVRIAVAPDGAPWIVNSEGGIYRRTRNSWQRMPGLANDIGVGASGSVWITGTDATDGGYGIYHWNGSDWTRIDGGAAEISVR